MRNTYKMVLMGRLWFELKIGFFKYQRRWKGLIKNSILNTNTLIHKHTLQSWIQSQRQSCKSCSLLICRIPISPKFPSHFSESHLADSYLSKYRTIIKGVPRKPLLSDFQTKCRKNEQLCCLPHVHILHVGKAYSISFKDPLAGSDITFTLCWARLIYPVVWHQLHI